MSDPTGDFVSRLGRLDSCAVSDALDKLRIAGVVPDLPQYASARRIAGRVVTVKLGTGARSSEKPRHLCAAAVELAQSGDILVVEQRTGVVAGCWGGILTLAAKLRGVAGVVADGLVRDIEEARHRDFPVFARGVTTFTARGRIVELSTNQPVRIGDVEVKAGDYVIADASGVVFIPAGDIGRVSIAAEEIAARQAAMTEALLAGEPVTQVMGADYQRMLRR